MCGRGPVDVSGLGILRLTWMGIVGVSWSTQSLFSFSLLDRRWYGFYGVHIQRLLNTGGRGSRGGRYVIW